MKPAICRSMSKWALLARGRCPHCFAKMKTGQAIGQTSTGTEDFGDIVTHSPGGPGKLISCKKCPGCGYSVT